MNQLFHSSLKDLILELRAEVLVNERLLAGTTITGEDKIELQHKIFKRKRLLEEVEHEELREKEKIRSCGFGQD